MRLECEIIKDDLTLCDVKQHNTSLVFTFANRIGLDGETPYIGENGNWWIGGKDTGVKAQGPQGEQGLQGDPFTYGDFTPEQIAELQKPATEAAGRADAAAVSANESAAKANGAAEAADEAREGIQSDLAKKADKVVPTASGNLAGLTGEGNLEDSGIAPGSVARLDSQGELLPDQVPPLLGRQTGVRLGAGQSPTSSSAVKYVGGPVPVGTDDFSLEFFGNTAGSNGYQAPTVFNAAVTNQLGAGGFSVCGTSSYTLDRITFQSYQSGYDDSVVLNIKTASVEDLFHLVVTRKGTTVKVYFNGVLRATKEQSAVKDLGDFQLGIANSSQVSLVRLYNYALSDGEAEELWNGGRPGEYVLPSTDSITVPGEVLVSEAPNNPYTWNGMDSEHVIPIAVKHILPTGTTWIFRVKVSNYVVGAPFLKVGNGPSRYNIPAADGEYDIICTVDRAYSTAFVYMYGANSDQDRRLTMEILSIIQIGCAGEYQPCGLLPDRWRDTSGSGVDLEAAGAPELNYQPVPDLRDIVIDTGVFYTNIASGVAGKSISVPEGYAVDTVVVKSYNGQPLTGVSVLNGYSDRYFIYNQDISMVGGRDTLVAPGVGLFDRIQYAQTYASNKATPITVNATGNTTEGGMRIKVFCRWIGF